MSRAANQQHRHIEDCLADRSEMRDWIERAQAIASWIHVTESDWVRHGDVTPEEWLVDRGMDDPRDDWDWGDETREAPDLYEHEPEDQYRMTIEDYDDWGDEW